MNCAPSSSRLPANKARQKPALPARVFEKPRLLSLCAASRPRQLDHIRRRSARHDRVETPRPRVQGRALFGGIVVTVINCRDALDRAALVVQDGLDHMRRDLHLRELGSHAAPNVVNRPMRNGFAKRELRYLGVQPRFRFGEGAGSRSAAAEHERRMLE